MAAGKGGAGYLAEYNALQIELESTIYPISNLGNLHPDKAVRDAAEPCLQKVTAFNTDLFQSEKLYARVRDIQPADAAEAKLKKNLTEGFEDSGVALPPEKRARAKEIATRLEQLRQSFERAVRDDATTVRFTAAELAGVPESFLESRKPGADGSYVLKPDPPTYDAVMRNAKGEDTRKRMFVARVRRGGEGNIAILDEAYQLRQELAALHGQPTFAHHIQRRRMVGSPEVVRKFLAEVKSTVADKISIRAVYPLADIRDVRHEDGRLLIHWKSGKESTLLGDKIKVDGDRDANRFRPEDAERLVAAIRARLSR
jgi:thimet oligopeptidase